MSFSLSIFNIFFNLNGVNVWKQLENILLQLTEKIKLL